MIKERQTLTFVHTTGITTSLMWIPAEGPEDKKNFGGEDGKGGGACTLQ